MPIKCLAVDKKEMTRDLGKAGAQDKGDRKWKRLEGRVMPCSTHYPSGRPGRLTGKDGVFSAALPHCPARDA